MATLTLPQFRKDLKVFKGPYEIDGSPSYNINDPISGKFYKLRWGEYLMYSHLRPGMTMHDFLEELKLHSTLDITEEEVRMFLNDATQQRLLDIPYGSQVFIKQNAAIAASKVKNVFSKIIYFRVPLFNPDKFLEKTLPYISFLGSKGALIAYLFICLLGILLVFNRIDEYFGTFLYFYNLQGIIFYIMGIFSVKVIHELAHAYAAKYYGVHVTKMGLIFIVLWPALFTDVTDGWKLWRRNQRMAISFSGVASELVMAGLASIGWYLSPPGNLQSLFFVISSVTWVSTLIGNMNPALRFDGYYLLADFLGIDNLQARAFAIGRWKMHSWLLGYTGPCPEEGLSQKQIRWMASYAIFTVLYRLILYTAIALFVYHLFTKVLGLFLFFTEIIFFIIIPIKEEIEFIKQKKIYMLNKRSAITYGIILLFLIWFILPWPHTARFTAISIPGQYQVIYVPEESVIEKIYVHRGSEVKAGDLIVKLESKQLEQEIGDTILQIKILDNTITLLSLKDEDIAYISEKKAAALSYLEKFIGLQERVKALSLTAKLNGDVYYFDRLLRDDMPVQRNTLVAKIAPKNSLKIIGFVPEEYITYFSQGKEAIYLDGSTYKSYPGKITKVSFKRNETLPYKQLASVYQGTLPVVQDEGGGFKLVDTYFQVEMKLDDNPNINFGETGYIEVKGPWESKLFNLLRFLISVFWRESGF